jgi:hypothetical protein
MLYDHGDLQGMHLLIRDILCVVLVCTACMRHHVERIGVHTGHFRMVDEAGGGEWGCEVCGGCRHVEVGRFGVDGLGDHVDEVFLLLCREPVVAAQLLGRVNGPLGLIMSLALFVFMDPWRAAAGGQRSR